MMHAWESIQKTIDYIEENLVQQMTPETLAKVAALSPFYFQRLFTRLVKRPVSDYVKMRRLAWAAELLPNKEERILDVALEVGFNSHESLTKAFKSAYGITPEEYRSNPVPLNQVIKPDLLLNYVMIDEGVPLISDGIVLEINRRKLDTPETYIGFSGKVRIDQQTPVGEATGIDAPHLLWDKFHQSRQSIPNLLSDGITLGASTMGADNDGTFNYFAGGATVPGQTVEGYYATYELPAAEYIVCSFEAETPEELRTSVLDKAMKYLLGTWLPHHNMMTQPFSAEKYGQADAGTANMEIWVIPVPAENTGGM